MRKVDQILMAGTILAMDEAMSEYSPGAIAIAGDSIVAVGPQAEIAASFTANETLDFGDRVMMPGLVNAHTHVSMTLLRGLADDLRLDVWLLGYMMPVEREYVSPEFVKLGMTLGAAEMIRSGITSFADMYYYESDVSLAAAEAGMRALAGQTVMKYPAPDAASYEAALAYTRDFIQHWKGHPLIVPAVAPHAPYTNTRDTLREAADLALEYDVPLHIHVSETAREVDDARRDWGMPVVPYIKKQGILDTKVLAAHCVHIDEGEIRTLRNANAGVAHNPSSNMKLASGFAPVPKMLELGINLGIGTDGAGSNNDLDMFEEFRLAALIAKGHSGDPLALPARQALTVATRLGARALHMGDITGSLEPGKRADLILIDLHKSHNVPAFRHSPDGVYSQIVYAAKATDVTDVMVNGAWLMRSRELLTVDEEKAMAEAQEFARDIDRFLRRRESSVLRKLLAIGGGMEQEASFEIQAKARVHDHAAMLARISTDEALTIRRHVHYAEFDTYYIFDDEDSDRLRIREDEFLDADGNIERVRYRLTLLGPATEAELDNAVLLSRSRYIAPSNNTLRFYREYFRPAQALEIHKDRLRWLVIYRGVEFYINLDRMKTPAIGDFIEIKSRTWSLRDAEDKAVIISELLRHLGIADADLVTEQYHELAVA